MPVIAGRLHRLAEEGFYLGKVGSILLILPGDLSACLSLLLAFGILLRTPARLHLSDQCSDFPGSQIPGDDLIASPLLLHIVEAAALSSFPSHCLLSYRIG